jgi:hypothetical protein
MLAVLVYHVDPEAQIAIDGYPWWCEWYRLLLHALKDTELCNFIFIYAVAYYEAARPGGGILTARDVVTLLLVVEITFLLGPLSGLVPYIWNQNDFDPSLLQPPYYPRFFAQNEAPRWFLLTVFEAKLYIAFCALLHVPSWLQLLLLAVAELVCFGSVLTVCASNTSYSLVAFLVNLFYLNDQGFDSKDRFDASDSSGSTCSSVLSFEGSSLAMVRVYDISLFCLVYHFGPALVRAIATSADAAKHRITAGLQARAPALYQSARLVSGALTIVVGTFLLALAITLTLVYIDRSRCQGFESGIFHPSLYNHSTRFGSWGGASTIVPLELAWPEWYHAHPQLNQTEVDAGDRAYNQGLVCAVSNVLVYTLATTLIGVSLACCACVHCKLAGSTTLGAYLVQIFLWEVPGTWKDTAFGETFKSGAPFEQLDVVLFCFIVIQLVAGPLFQWYVVIPQIQLMLRVSDHLREWWEESIQPELDSFYLLCDRGLCRRRIASDTKGDHADAIDSGMKAAGNSWPSVEARTKMGTCCGAVTITALFFSTMLTAVDPAAINGGAPIVTTARHEDLAASGARTVARLASLEPQQRAVAASGPRRGGLDKKARSGLLRTMLPAGVDDVVWEASIERFYRRSPSDGNATDSVK